MLDGQSRKQLVVVQPGHFIPVAQIFNLLYRLESSRTAQIFSSSSSSSFS
jgi:hypothetical protein